MKKAAHIGLALLLLASAAITTTVFSSFRTKTKSNVAASKPETQTCYGPTVTTVDLHNTECSYCNNAQFDHMCMDNRWCFGRYTFTVSAPSGWHFTGDPHYHCVSDNQGSFGWNMGYSARNMQIVERNPRYIKVIGVFGSRQIAVNLSCEATRDE